MNRRAVVVGVFATLLCIGIWAGPVRAMGVRTELIADGAFSITVPRPWRITRRDGFEIEDYLVTDRGRLLFVISFLNNPSLDQIRNGKQARPVLMGAGDATEHFVHSRDAVSYILVSPHCKPVTYKYVRLSAISERKGDAKAISDAMRSLTCSPEQAPSSSSPSRTP